MIAQEQKYIRWAIGLVAVLLLALMIYTPVNYDSGDGYQHYLISRYSWVHPSLFFDHWGKPVFILLSSPFTQLGYTGVQVFNILCGLLSGWLLYRSLRITQPSWALIGFVLLFCMPKFLLSLFSGLTEPLFGLFLIAGIYFVLANKPKTAAVIISFLPFVRSEGMIIGLVFLIYFIVKRNYTTIPWLAAGNVLYAIAGYFHYHDLLWYYTQNPYRGAEHYGCGDWLHFADQLPYVFGLPMAIFTAVGIVIMLYKSINWVITKKPIINTEKLWLVYGCFGAYFMSHTIFWALGIFSSFGLNRVLIVLGPLGVIITIDFLIALKQLIEKNSFKWAKYPFIALLIYTLVFPVSGNPASLHPKDFDYDDGQKTINTSASWLSREYRHKISLYYFSHPYMAERLHLDPFNTNDVKSADLALHPTEVPENALILWDNWFAGFEDGINKSVFQNDTANFEQLFSSKENNAELIIFRRKE